jgi:hypothetical protein
MDKQELYNIWAPPYSVWSPWAKPVLFAHYPMPLPELVPPPPPDLSEIPSALGEAGQERWAVVVDLPGPQSVFVGLALAEIGYRPVPLFNACPPPAHYPPQSRQAVVDMDIILAALVLGAERLKAISLPDNAPPAFLVNSDRQTIFRPIHTGHFDNRSVVFVTDFPSANFLARQSIHRALLLLELEPSAQRDLAFVLHTWQKARVMVSQKRMDQLGALQPLNIGGFWFLFDLMQRLRVFFQLRRGKQGGFGNFVGYDPEAAEAAGG